MRERNLASPALTNGKPPARGAVLCGCFVPEARVGAAFYRLILIF